MSEHQGQSMLPFLFFKAMSVHLLLK